MVPSSMWLTAVFLVLLTALEAVVWSLPDADCSDVCLPLPRCDHISNLSPLETFPSGTTALEVSGRLEKKISRGDLDFQKLVQLRGDGLVIVNEEETNTWCGNETRPCVNCQNGQPAATDDRDNADQCADRLMSGRLHSRLKLLQRLANREWPNRQVRVLEAWEEPTATNTGGIHPAYSLHYEGRAARVDVSVELPSQVPAVPDSSEDPQLVSRLGALAICAGFDHVSHDVTDAVNYLSISVKKQKGKYGRITTFLSGATFTEVDIPHGHDLNYKLSHNSCHSCPLFDSDGQSDHQLSPHYRVSDFLSHHPVTTQPYRYFRLRPELVYCLEVVRTALNEDLRVISGYRTITEDQSKPSNQTDTRLHITGQGLQTQTTNSHIKPYDLATAVAEECGTYFISRGQNIGITLLSDSVYFDIRDSFFISMGYDVNQPTLQEFHDQMSNAISTSDRRVKYNRACDASSPSAQSASYKYKEIPQDLGGDQCQSKSQTSNYCSQTEQSRNAWVESIWQTVKLKYFKQTNDEMQLAIKDCLEPCGQCTTGETWKTKLAGCNKFVHWAPLQLTISSQQQTNSDASFYPSNNQMATAKACESNKKCISHTEMFSTLASAIEATYYPTNTSLNTEKLFGMPHNPTPLFDIMQETFAMHASGNTTVWISSTENMAALLDVFKALLIHNRQVDKVTIWYLESQLNEVTVIKFLENSIRHWTHSGCISTSRSHATPYEARPFTE